MHSLGAVPDINPAIERRFNALADDVGVRALSAMGIALVGSSALDQRAMHTLVAELPGIDTLSLSLEQLAALAARSRVKRLPVHVHGDVVSVLQRNWPAVRAAQSEYEHLGKALSKERDDGTVALSSALVQTLAQVVAKKE